ncbi:MAG: sigma-54-dependent Fis family transcriptional regulator [Candidatus Eisenbacteria bacterium]|nr:sigma-54-dependent Fis family transcriptional regulator [Candidatus Eisenbacteria bacterium]
MPSSILIIDDQDSLRHFLEKALADEGHEVRSAATGGEGIAAFEEQTPDLILLDLRLPDRSGLDLLTYFKERAVDVPVILMTAFAEVETAVAAMKRGAYDYLTKPVNLEQVSVVVAKGLEETRVRRELEHHKRTERERFSRDFVRGASHRMRQVYELVEKVAATDSTGVLITGESGTGKQLIASLIHSAGPRANQPFLEINCAAIPGELLESELFGHERGAFTDARQMKQGLLELANGGTLFLDEVGEMPIALQSKLLKVLEGMTFRRVGGTRDLKVSVRIVSATNQDLEKQVREGKFREDLYYRLLVVPVQMPALRDRREDIPLLARHFIAQFARQFHKQFRGLTPEAEQKLIEYPWPGNVRELRNLCERTVLLEDGELVQASHLRLNAAPKGQTGGSVLEKLHRILIEGQLDPGGVPFEEILNEIERGLIIRAAESTGWNQCRTADVLGVKRDKLRYRMKLHNLSEEDATPTRPRLVTSESPSYTPAVDSRERKVSGG